MTELLPAHRVIERVAVGTLHDPEVFELILGVQQLQKDTGIGDTLLDCRDLTQGSASVPVLDLASRVADLGMESHWRQALEWLTGQ
jgi:hypothetical protein